MQFVIRITDTTLSFAGRAGGEWKILYEPYYVKMDRSAAANLREAFLTSPLLKSAPRKAVVAVSSPVLLIPLDDYEKDRAGELYEYAYPETEGARLYTSVLPYTKTAAVFPMNRDLGVVLSDHFDEISVEPLMSRLWDFFPSCREEGRGRKMYVYFHEDKMEITAFHRRRFLFSNTFTSGLTDDTVDDTTNDTLYYILGAWQQTGFSPGEDSLVLCGDLPWGETLAARIRKFVPDVTWLDREKEFGAAVAAQTEGMPLDMVVRLV